MTMLFALAGVDYLQWKAVSRTLLRGDFRVPGGQSGETYSLRSSSGLLVMVPIYGLFGLSMAVLIVMNPDALLTGTVTLTYLSFLIVTSILTQHGNTVMTTTDYAILAPRPVSSRTVLAIRVTNILFHVTLITTLMGYPAILAFTFAHGVSIPRGLAAGIGLYAWALAITLTLVAVYGRVLRLLAAERVQHVLGYAQLAIGVVAYGGFFLLMNSFGRSTIAGVSMPREWWLVLVPPAWYASYLESATGRGDALTWMLTAGSIASLVVLASTLRGQLGRTYADQLAELAATPSTSKSKRDSRAGRLLFARDEGRAVWMLVRAHFRHDTRVRLGVLAIVPMTVLYMLAGARDGQSGDPFVPGRQGAGFDLISMAVLMFPSVLTQQFSAADAYKASWIYFVTAADRGRLVVAAKNVITAFFLLPFLMFLLVIMMWRFDHIGHAMVHTACLGLVSHLMLQITVAVRPKLPFALEPQKSSGDAVLIVVMLMSIAGGTALLFAMERWIYPEWTRLSGLIVVLVALSWLLDGVLRARASRPM